MELPKPDDDQIPVFPKQEENVNQLSEELHLLKQHVDNQFARQREYIELAFELERERSLRLVAELKSALLERFDEKFEAGRKEFNEKFEAGRKEFNEKFDAGHKEFNEKFDAARNETAASLTDLHNEMDRKFLRIMTGLVSVMLGLAGVIAGQVALFFR